MVALIGTATSLPTLLEGFMRLNLEAIAACRTAVPFLAGPDERALVIGLRDDHERHLAELKGLARIYGANVPDNGTMHEARTIGRIRLAHRRGGDGAVLAAVETAASEAIYAYERGLRNAALPDSLRPAFERALGDLRRHRLRLGDAARLAA